MQGRDGEVGRTATIDGGGEALVELKGLEPSTPCLQSNAHPDSDQPCRAVAEVSALRADRSCPFATDQAPCEWHVHGTPATTGPVPAEPKLGPP